MENNGETTASKKIKLPFSTDSFVKSVKEIGVNVLMFVLGMVVLTGYNFYRENSGEKKQNIYVQKSLKDVTIAVNESKDLFVIDRSTGTYVMYKDEVGKIIFDMYLSKYYTKKETKDTKNE